MRYDLLPTLETERLVLRPITKHDVADIFQYAQDPEVTRLLAWGPSKSIQETQQVVEQWIANYKHNKIAPWGIVDKQTDKVIGAVEACIDPAFPAHAELGYCLSKYYWGKGIMLEAFEVIIPYLFAQPDIKEIIAFVRNDNRRSRRLLENAGFSIDQYNAKRECMKGTWVDLDRWAVHKNT